MPCRAKAAVYLAMSSPWPTLAAACWVARSLGRRDSPSGTRPDAIAPDDTSTSCVPAWTRVARAAARASITSPAISPSVVVKDEEPTFTTTLSAPSMSGRATSGRGRSGRGRVVSGPGVMETAGGRSRAGRGAACRPWTGNCCGRRVRLLRRPSARPDPSRTPRRRPGRRSGPRRPARPPPRRAPLPRPAGPAPAPPRGGPLSHARRAQPVRQVADRLIVTEVGLPDPPLRLLAADEEALPDPDHLEARFVGGLHDHPDPFGGLLGGAGGPVRRDQGGHGEAQLTQALAGRGGDLEDLIAAGLELGLDQVGLLAG